MEYLSLKEIFFQRKDINNKLNLLLSNKAAVTKPNSLQLLFIIIILFVSSAFTQDMQYVSSQSGDTLVVKDDKEFGGSNTLYLLMASDSLALQAVYMC